MTAPTIEKAAPIPAEDAVDTVASMLALNDGRKYVCGPDFDLAYKIVRAIAEQDRADRASQEERIREDERDRLLERFRHDSEVNAYSIGLLVIEGAMPPADRARLRGDAS